LCCQTVIEQSKIYGKGKGDNVKLTKWQKEVNQAAFDICMQSNEMLYDRANLKMNAKRIARETYTSKKEKGQDQRNHASVQMKGRFKFPMCHSSWRK
jgi:hypothetical protein